MKHEIKFSRRQLLKWTTPSVVAITLPVHAQTSPMPEPEVCMPSPPDLSVLAAPKCSGNPPVGTAVIEILSANDFAITVTDIIVTSNDPKSDISSIPSLPFDVTDVDGETVTWIGPASDGISCLPLAQVSIEIFYNCDGGETQSETYDITQLLVDSIP
jgi:hypothetical protein